MKKFFLIVALAAALVSCGHSGKDAVKAISDNFVSGKISKFVIDENVMDSKSGQLKTDKFNLFEDESVKDIIEDNKDYKLTKEDKSTLTKAIDNMTIETQWDMIPSSVQSLLTSEHASTMVKLENKTRVLDASTLGDLRNH